LDRDDAAFVYAADLLVTSYSFDVVMRYEQEAGGSIKVFTERGCGARSG